MSGMVPVYLVMGAFHSYGPPAIFGDALSVQARPLVAALAALTAVSAKTAPSRAHTAPIEDPAVVRKRLAPLGSLPVEHAKRVHDVIKRNRRARARGPWRDLLPRRTHPMPTPPELRVFPRA
jgi:hypothetical protein